MKNELKSAVRRLCAVLALFAVPALAHHGTNITYDQSKAVVLKGTVTEYKFANPHVEIHLDVKDASGKAVNWNLEGAGVYYFSKVGWNRTSLKAGDEVTITINPARIGGQTGVILKMVTAGGKQFVSDPATETAK